MRLANCGSRIADGELRMADGERQAIGRRPPDGETSRESPRDCHSISLAPSRRGEIRRINGVRAACPVVPSTWEIALLLWRMIRTPQMETGATIGYRPRSQPPAGHRQICPPPCA